MMKAKNFVPKWMPPGSEVVTATAAATVFSVYYGYEGGVVGEIAAVGSDAGSSFFDGLAKIPV